MPLWRALDELGHRIDRDLGMDEEETPRRPCVRCQGSGLRICESCEGVGCGACRRKGRVPCAICDGIGDLPSAGQMVLVLEIEPSGGSC
ncbi:MAG: hypothetical protein KGI98_14510 [Euryarchaeota archaeon]|nr:hypothetical protein [Euryarchaeota archaeon]MDE1881157.1 hypothetical protein [Euryarchaeota archaeon]